MQKNKHNRYFVNKYTISAVLIFIIALIAIKWNSNSKIEPEEQVIRPVRTIKVERKIIGESSSLTGEILAKNEIDVSFQINGKLTERLVSVGDQVAVGQVLARIDPRDTKDSLISAKSNLIEAQSLLTQAVKNEARQKTLLSKGVITNAKYENATMQLQSAQAKVVGANAKLNQAKTHLNYTNLTADVSGIVVTASAEAGEVIKSGQPIVSIATDEGVDAVFYIPEQLLQNRLQQQESNKDSLIEVSLSHDDHIKTVGYIREISPQADSITRSFIAKVGLTNPPKEFKLGSTITGSMILNKKPVIELPVMSLNKSVKGPAVWVVDPDSNTVSLRDITISSYTEHSVIVDDGLENDDIVVTAGVHLLYPGQTVKLLKDK